MHERVIDRMQARARAVRARAEVRRWSYRQRHLAGGAWYALRRVLADARAAFVIPEADARRLIAEGHAPHPSGRRVSPEKTLLFVDEQRLSSIETRRQIPVNLGPEFLAATAIALVAFDTVRR